jgi:hypothetical protein
MENVRTLPAVKYGPDVHGYSYKARKAFSIKEINRDYGGRRIVGD